MLLKVNCFLTLANTFIVSSVSTAFSSVALTQLVQDLKYVYGAKYSAGKCLITGQQSVQAEDAGLVPTQNKSASEKLVEEWLSMHTGQGELAHSVVWLCSTDLGYLTLCAGCCSYHSCVPGTERTARVSIQANATLRILLILPLLFWGKPHHSQSQIYFCN